MPPRPHFNKAAIKHDYADQSPKDVNEESVDDLLANVDNFIESVYRDLNVVPTQEAYIGGSRVDSRMSLNDTSSSSSTPTSPDGASSLLRNKFVREATPMVSPVAGFNRDADIERINRMCDNVDRNLRSIGLFMNNSPNNSVSENLSNSDLTNSPHSTASNVTPAETPILNANENSRRRGTSGLVTTQVIDLSNSQADIFTQPFHCNNHNDSDNDDVILVSANIPPVVDLCTPCGCREKPETISTVGHRQLNRRRIYNYDDGDTHSEGGTTRRKRRTVPSVMTSGETPPDCEISPPSAASDGGPKFICPVCMDSYLQRQPTTTLCGHVFCKDCIERAISLTHKCPMCNKKMSSKKTFRIYY